MMTALEDGRYVDVAINFTVFVGEEVLFVLSIGQTWSAYYGANAVTGIPKVPFKYGNLPRGIQGTTTKFGKIKIQRSLPWDKFVGTLRHESIHHYLSPTYSPIIGRFRAWLRTNTAYSGSHLYRFLEEGMAEAYSTRSVLKGILFPFTHELTGKFSFINGYYANVPSVIVESALIGWGYIKLLNYASSIDLVTECEITGKIEGEVTIEE